METNKYVIQFNEDFKKIYEKERGSLVWSEDICKVILDTTPTRIGEDYVYEFETEHKLGLRLSYRANKITINGKVVKNRYGHTDYEPSDEELAQLREHGQRNMNVIKEIARKVAKGYGGEIMEPIIEHHEQLIREKAFRKQCREELFKNL